MQMIWNICISTISNIAADTVVIFFTVALVERRNPSNSSYARDVIIYLMNAFRLERGINLYYRDICYPGNGEKAEKNKNW
jgi:hypothetical protein